MGNDGVVAGEMGMGMGMQCNFTLCKFFVMSVPGQILRNKKKRGEGEWYEIDNRTQRIWKGGHFRTNSKSLPSKCSLDPPMV
jgi:hypothetical protein